MLVGAGSDAEGADVGTGVFPVAWAGAEVGDVTGSGAAVPQATTSARVKTNNPGAHLSNHSAPAIQPMFNSR
ncbi:MAG: hypothetical protein O2860_12460 [Chloroflexi bacterium]|nr:hypothetical protein [Chloroflexota bacterium]